MTRNEYLENLNRSLYFLAADVRQATITFYAELLEDRMEEGMTEEEAVQAMEDAELIASRMRAENQDESRGSDGTLSPCTIHYTQDDLSSLYVELIDRPVIVEPSSQSQLTVSYMENEKCPLTYSDLGGHVRLIEKTPLNSTSFRLFNLSLGNALDAIFKGTQTPDPTVRIQVPCNRLFAMEINTSNGKIHLASLNGMGEIRLKSSNGSISLQQTRCELLSAQTSNGRIALEQVQAVHRLTAQSTNGRIEAEEIRSRGSVECITTNARIHVRNSQGEDQLYLRSSNSSIHVHRCDFPALFIKTSNGHVEGTLPGEQSDYRISSKTSNGFNNLPAEQSGSPRVLNVTTSNGNIRMTFEPEKAE